MKTRTKLRAAAALIAIVAVAILAPYYRFITGELHISPIRTLLSIGDLKTADGSVTVLLLGIPGEPHDGPNLSDSIVLASYNLKKHKVVTVNIPRDIWSPTLGDRINAAYAVGEAKKKNGGLALARAQMAQVAGRPIYYAAVINFAGFQEIIDFLGGVDIEVERSFTDKKYPIAGRENDECPGEGDEHPCRYETVSFQKGTVHMDGATALKFVRTRNAVGAEGSDFARGRRQEKVVAATETKIIEVLSSFDLAKIRKLYALGDKTVKRNISNQDAAILLKNMLFAGTLKSSSVALREDAFIVPPTYVYGKYVLVPKEGTHAQQTHINCLLDTGQEKSCQD